MNLYQELYDQKKMSPDEIIAMLEDGMCGASDTACANPPALMDALGRRAKAGTIHHFTMNTTLDLAQLGSLGHDSDAIRPISWFSGVGLRKEVNAGRADVMSSNYSEMPELYGKYRQIDVAFATVSPMDKHGYFSTGISASYSNTIFQKAKYIFLEVNDKMPRSVHGPQVHISQVTALCENNVELAILNPVEPDDTAKKIGEYIAEQIPNGATIQLGIGAIPEAVAASLSNHKHLGVHSEMFTNSMVDLTERGIIDNSCKPFNVGHSVCTFAFGNRRMYDFLDDNPSVDFLPVDYVNNPRVIEQIPNFMSINAALSVDFYGQVCAESIGTYHVSGSGGQLDFVRGAVGSPGGCSFIAFPSTAQGGKVSRIQPVLELGSVITTGKNDVDAIVTEYGIAWLRGRTLSERTKALISAAHPDFRDELTFKAKEMHIMI